MRALSTLAAAAAVLLAAAVAWAIPPFEVPPADRPPEVDRPHGVLRVAALGIPDERLGRLSAARAAARASARSRAIRALHAFADDALAEVRACPREADAIHRAIDASAETAGIRALPDGGAVVVVEVELAVLRSAAEVAGVPWAEAP